MTEQKKVLRHCPPLEYTRDENGVLVEYAVWRKAHPLTPEQIAVNRAGFVKMFNLSESDFGEEAR